MNNVIVALVYITIVPILAKRYIKFNEEPSDLVVMRNKPAELRCNITAKNNVTVSWIKDDTELDLRSDTRRTILSHGSLYFKTIVRKKNLSPDVGVYRCVGETIVNGRSFKIHSRKARLTVVGMSKSFVVKPQNLTVSESETALFKCKIKRSRPNAKITWSKEGKNTDLTLNSRFVVFPSGSLEILGVMSSDAGNYICKATNEELGRSITAKATLTVTPASTTPKPKRFLVKPSNKTVFHNEDAILECLITGYPKPQVEWQKDGTTITLADNGHYSKYGVSSLKVSAAQAADSGMYECVMGTEKAKAYLQVVVPPQFKVLPQDVETVESKDIKIPCEITGNPKPKINWYKNGDEIDEIEYEHIAMEDDGITIMEVLESDEGIYECSGKYGVVEIKASAQLTIKGPPTTAPPTTLATTTASTPTVPVVLAPSKPRNVNAAAENTTAIRVFWQEPDQPHGKITKYTVVTYEWAATGSQFQSMLATKDTHLVVTGLKPGTLYEFIVYASNEYKQGALSTSVQEYTLSQKPPTLGAPRDVKVTAINSFALDVTWKPPLNALVVIKNYSIEYRDMDRLTPWRIKSSLRHKVVLLQLLPYTQYSVKVTAHTDRGPGQTSSSVIGRTKSGKPNDPPGNIRLDVTGDFLVARWDPPSNPNGNITGYMIELRNENFGNVSSYTTKINYKVFMNVEKATTYAFRVAGVTEAGRGEFSKWKTKDMPPLPITEDVVPGKPTNLVTRVVLGMVQVSWSPPRESHIVVRQYVLSYGKMTPDDTFKYFSNTTTSALLPGLQSDTIYIIRVRAQNNKGQGLEALERVTIPRLKQSSGIYRLQAVPIKKRAMRLSWIDPAMNLQPNVGYHVKFEKDNNWQYFNVTKRTYLIVKDLRPGMTYTFYAKKNNEPNYISVSNATREEVPSPPKDITVSVSEEQATFKVHWNTPDEPNGKLTNYKICWRPFDKYRKYNWTCKTVKAHVLNDKISNVNESLRYVVKILAKNRAGEGKFSKPEIFLGDSIMSLPSIPVLDPTTFNNGTPVEKFERKSTEKNLDHTPPMKGNTLLTGTPSQVDKKNRKASGGLGMTSNGNTLWIVIAVIAAITLIAIVIISIVLCKKRSRDAPVVRRKPPADPYKAVANGNGKKKPGNKENYWIKQDQMELEPCVKKDEGIASTIPRSADEMKPLDSPFQSRKDRDSLDKDENEPVEADYPPTSLADEPPYRHREAYQPLPLIPPKQGNMNIQKSPFMPQDSDEFPPPPECLNENEEEGPSSDYGSEEIVSPKSETGESPDVTYMPKNTPNGCVSVAPDYNYPMNKRVYDSDATNLQNLMKDLDAIMAKEDRV